MYHSEVDVYWQENTWADTEFSVQWVKKTLKETIKELDGKEFVFFYNNLTVQTSDEFMKAVREINGII